MRKLGPPPKPNKFDRPIVSKPRKRHDYRDKYELIRSQRHLIVSLVRGVQVCITKHDGKIHTYPEDPAISRMRLAGFDRLERLGFIAKGADSPFYYYWIAARRGREVADKLNV